MLFQVYFVKFDFINREGSKQVELNYKCKNHKSIPDDIVEKIYLLLKEGWCMRSWYFKKQRNYKWNSVGSYAWSMLDD